MVDFREDAKDRGLKEALTARHPIRRLVAVALATTNDQKSGAISGEEGGSPRPSTSSPSHEPREPREPREPEVKITAAGRGKLAEQILEMAFARGIKVREDADLAELLAKMELDSPVPSEAIVAVAEILAKVYEANNNLCNLAQNDPFSETSDSPPPPPSYKVAGETA